MPLLPLNLPDETLSEEEITPFHPEICAREATLNVGCIGHVAHGKSSLVRALTGVNTVKFASEKEHNITIKLGYANCKVFACPVCPEPFNCYSYSSAASEPVCPKCGALLELKRHISFTDCPGHDQYMTTMLSGAAVMDATILLIAANEECPQPQTTEHAQAIFIEGGKECTICENKIDLISQQEAERNYEQILRFTQQFDFMKGAKIVPTSAVRGLNINAIAYYLSKIEIPERDLTAKPLFTIIRSFDVNKSGMSPEEIAGGVIGGTLQRGIFKLGEIVEIRPGIVSLEDNVIMCYPLRTKIVSLKTEQNDLKYAIPGGSIAIGTLLDPAITKNDRLIGQFMGIPGFMPSIYRQLEIQFNKLDNSGSTEENNAINTGEVVLLTIAGCNSSAHVLSVNNSNIIVKFDENPVCVELETKIAVSKKNAYFQSKNWRLIGYGVVIAGDAVEANGTESI